MKRIILAAVAVIFLGLAPALSAQEVEVTIDTQPEKKELTQAQKDSIVYSQLSPEQLMELKRMEMEVEKERIEARTKNDLPISQIALLLIVLAPFLFVIAIVIINNRSKQTESRRRYDIYMKSIEMGQPIPEHFFEEPEKKNKSSNLKRGIISMMVGLAFGIYVLVSGDRNLAFMMAALIPGLVGIGYILVHVLDKPKAENYRSTNEQD